MQEFNVQGMTCGHCVRAVTQAVQALDAAAVVEVDLANSKVRVQSQQSPAAIVDAIQEEGYKVAE
ncbi:heavy-metal-associated domain-containing protein [Pseudomonas sp. TE3610]